MLADRQCPEWVVSMSVPLTTDDVRQVLKTELPRLTERYGVTRLALFGSHANGTAREDSDVDLLVELEKPLGLGFVRLAGDLEELLGRQVDLATFGSLRRSLNDPRRRHIAAEVERSLVWV